MTECETCMLCQSTNLMKFNASGSAHHEEGVEGTDIISWVEVANAGPADHAEPPWLVFSTRQTAMNRKWRKEKKIITKSESHAGMSALKLLNGEEKEKKKLSLLGLAVCLTFMISSCSWQPWSVCFELGISFPRCLLFLPSDSRVTEWDPSYVKVCCHLVVILFLTCICNAWDLWRRHQKSTFSLK